MNSRFPERDPDKSPVGLMIPDAGQLATFSVITEGIAMTAMRYFMKNGLWFCFERQARHSYRFWVHEDELDRAMDDIKKQAGAADPWSMMDEDDA